MHPDLPRRAQEPRPRPRLDPDTAAVRRAVRGALAGFEPDTLVLAGVSGGPDSLALACAARFEGAKAGVRVGAVIVDHGLQDGSAEVASRTARILVDEGLDPVVVRRVRVVEHGDGPEGAARRARYTALEAAAVETGARAILLGHTLQDQAETVLLALARGSGIAALTGMARETDGPVPLLRPLLAIERRQTEGSCRALGIEPWRDPHNDEARFARVRARRRVMPRLERELGPGVAQALARTAALLADDAAYLDGLARDALRELAGQEPGAGAIELPRAAFLELPAALAGRVVRMAAHAVGAGSVTFDQVGAVRRLAVEGGRHEVHLPGARVEVTPFRLTFAAHPSARGRGADPDA